MAVKSNLTNMVLVLGLTCLLLPMHRSEGLSPDLS